MHSKYLTQILNLIYLTNILYSIFQTFITYNAALYEGVGFGSVMNAPSRVMRRDAIIAELMKPKNQADVVCLQEVNA